MTFLVSVCGGQFVFDGSSGLHSGRGGNAFLAAAQPGLEVVAGELDAAARCSWSDDRDLCASESQGAHPRRYAPGEGRRVC